MIDRRPGHPRLWLCLCAGLTVVILCLALLPGGSAPSAFGWDKLNHAGAIAVVTGLAFLALQPRGWAAAAAFLYGASLGLLIEMLQAALTADRTAEWGDVMADLVGAGCIWLTIRIYRHGSAAIR